MLSSRGQASGMLKLWQAWAALNGWTYSDVGCVNLSVRTCVISTVRVPTCASSSLHSCCRAAISLSFDSSASACWARSRARWRAKALLYCSADPGLIREGEFTCKITRRKYLQSQIKKSMHCASLIIYNTQKSEGNPVSPYLRLHSVQIKCIYSCTVQYPGLMWFFLTSTQIMVTAA